MTDDLFIDRFYDSTASLSLLPIPLFLILPAWLKLSLALGVMILSWGRLACEAVFPSGLYPSMGIVSRFFLFPALGAWEPVTWPDLV